MGNDWTKDFGFAREEIFRSEETLRTIRHIRASWGGEPEFLWEKFPDYAVFRRQDNAKWYAVILTVQAGKLGLADEGRTEDSRHPGRCGDHGAVAGLRTLFPRVPYE